MPPPQLPAPQNPTQGKLRLLKAHLKSVFGPEQLASIDYIPIVFRFLAAAEKHCDSRRTWKHGDKLAGEAAVDAACAMTEERVESVKWPYRKGKPRRSTGRKAGRAARRRAEQGAEHAATPQVKQEIKLEIKEEFFEGALKKRRTA